MNNTTILIKTFERPEAIARLMASIRQFYPDIPVVVIDDGNNSMLKNDLYAHNLRYVKTAFDIGLSAGRNLGLTMVETPYVFMCDDDCIFTAETDLNMAEKLMESSEADILGINAGVGYCGTFLVHGDTVTYSPNGKGYLDGGNIKFYDFVPNIFMAKTDKVRECKWDEELKMGEHFAYFFDHLGKIKVAYTPLVKMRHEHMSVAGYDSFRGRALDYVKIYMKKKGIKRRVDLDNQTIEI